MHEEPRTSAVEEKIFNLARPYLAVRDNVRHTLVTMGFAFDLLALVREADRATVMPAIMLHDAGWCRIPDHVLSSGAAYGPKADIRVTRIHEEEGAKIAGQILKEIGYDATRTEEIVAIIDGHDTRSVSLSLNDEVVKDADKLFRFCPVGLTNRARDYGMTPQENYARLEALVDTWLFLPEARMMARKELARSLAEIG
jgi:hypothetical protein